MVTARGTTPPERESIQRSLTDRAGGVTALLPRRSYFDVMDLLLVVMFPSGTSPPEVVVVSVMVVSVTAPSSARLRDFLVFLVFFSVTTWVWISPSQSSMVAMSRARRTVGGRRCGADRRTHDSEEPVAGSAAPHDRCAAPRPAAAKTEHTAPSSRCAESHTSPAELTLLPHCSAALQAVTDWCWNWLQLSALVKNTFSLSLAGCRATRSSLIGGTRIFSPECGVNNTRAPEKPRPDPSTASSRHPVRKTLLRQTGLLPL